jgi:hypothetical protein
VRDEPLPRQHSEPLEQFQAEFLHKASKGVIHSGASKHMAPKVLLHNLKRMPGRVRYGDCEIEIIRWHGWLCVDILFDPELEFAYCIQSRFPAGPLSWRRTRSSRCVGWLRPVLT